jgi:uncharacterized protein
MIATSPPFTLEVNRVSNALEISKEYLHRYIDYLEMAGLIVCLRSGQRGLKVARKPKKVYLHDPNLLFCLHAGAPRPDLVGSVRESFFLSQVAVRTAVYHDPELDFRLENGARIEVGGKNKKARIISGVENAYLALDDTTHGAGNTIPLYLFGFLY